jgi:integrase
MCMAGRQAKLISPEMKQRMLTHAAASKTPERDRVIILLSVKCGLRACEIAGLDWTMILGAGGEVSTCIAVDDRIAKRGSGRRIPIHPELHDALEELLNVDGGLGPVIRSSRGGAMRANSIVNWFVELFQNLGLQGCSSHSGRRSFITAAARNAHKAGGCLRDVQLLAGHRSIETTQGYIEGDTDAQRRLVALV